jgi:hypothetical protein
MLYVLYIFICYLSSASLPIPLLLIIINITNIINITIIILNNIVIIFINIIGITIIIMINWKHLCCMLIPLYMYLIMYIYL